MQDLAKKFIFGIIFCFILGWIADKGAVLSSRMSRDTGLNCGINATNFRGMGRDLMLDWLSDWGWDTKYDTPLHIPDFFLIAFFSLTFLFLIPGFADTWPLGFTRFGRFWCLYSAELVYRAMTVGVTGYLPTNADCITYNPTFTWWGNAYFFWIPTCGDYMFSGHTALFTMVAWFHLWFRGVECCTKSTVAQFVFSGVVVLAAMCGMGSLWAARYHYTSDVLISLYITSSWFWIYHALLERNALRYRNSGRKSVNNSDDGWVDYTLPSGYLHNKKDAEKGPGWLVSWWLWLESEETAVLISQTDYLQDDHNPSLPILKGNAKK